MQGGLTLYQLSYIPQTPMGILTLYRNLRGSNHPYHCAMDIVQGTRNQALI